MRASHELGVLYAMNATITWIANVESDLAGYLVYHGTAPGVYSESFVVTPPTVSKEFTGLDDRLPHYFSVTAYDTSDNESVKSLEVSKQVYLQRQTILTRGGWR